MLIPNHKIKEGVNYVNDMSHILPLTIEKPIPQKLARFWGWAFPNADLNAVYIAYGYRIYTNQSQITEDLVFHEREHVRQQREVGMWGDRIWLFFYLISKRIRYQVELQAYQDQCLYLGRTGYLSLEVVQEIAKLMSSSMYQARWERKPMVSYKQAYEDLQNVVSG